MNRNWLLIIPLFVGISLMISAWFQSYPIGIVSSDDWLFLHISTLYWIGLPLTLCSLYVIGLTYNCKIIQCLVALGIFFTIYSLSFYFSMLPGSDSQLFRGLNEFFQKTSSLTPDSNWHLYYEYPLFFILTQALVMITGLQLAHIEFLLYSLIGILIVLGLFIYFYKIPSHNNRQRSNLSFLPIVGFSIVMFSFFNYQAVPFSLATSIFIIILAIEKRFHSNTLSKTFTTIQLVLFVAICFMHLFVAAFFILFLFGQYLLNWRNTRIRAHYLILSVLTIVIYLSVQLFQASISLRSSTETILNNLLTSDLSKTVQQTFYSQPLPLDSLAQNFSRLSIIVAAAICVFGFLALFKARNLSKVDIALFFAGFIYLLVGTFLPILGSRAIGFIFIPLSLGVYYFTQGKKIIFIKSAFFICLILFTFVAIHHSFMGEVQYQTKEVYEAENFLLQHFSWNKTVEPKIIVDFRQSNYLTAFKATDASFFGENAANFTELPEYDWIIRTIGLEKVLFEKNITISDSVLISSFNLIYSNGYTELFTRSTT
jgi:hypothetical protein